jgi:hypothetical protein
MLVFACAFIPISSPVGSLAFKERYIAKALGGLVNPNDLIFDFRYELGWPEQVEAVQRAYGSLSEEQRRICVVLTGSYAQASAINILGKRKGLPPAISGHNACHTWGTHGATGACVLAYNIRPELLERSFRSVRPCGVIPPQPDGNNREEMVIYLCEQPTAPLKTLWRRFRHYG